MKKHLQLSAILLAIGAFLFAQEKIEVTMTVVKDGKVAMDTTYAFDDAKKAKHAIHMMDAMASGNDEMMIHDKDHNVIMEHHGDMKMHKEHMVFISEDGEKVKVSGEHGKNVWVEEGEDGETKVIIKEIGEGDCEHEGHKVIKKEIIMISGEEGEEGDWTVKEIKGEDGEVIVIKKKKGDDGEEEINVEVIVKEKEMKEKKMVKKEEIEKKEKQRKKK